jgi:ATP-dependent DNA ligase
MPMQTDILPPGLQPGILITMQPVDAARDRSFYIESMAYIGQPKRDGQRIVIFATSQGVSYQSRSTNLMKTPGLDFDDAFMAVAKAQGAYVLDGEKVYLDIYGGEHRSKPQAERENSLLGDSPAEVPCRLSIFRALGTGGFDRRQENDVARITAAEFLVERIALHLCSRNRSFHDQRIEMVPTAWSRVQKQELCNRQLADGREGEVWILANTTYLPGYAGEAMVRTKYMSETDCVVTELTESDKKNRPFAAIEVSERKADGSLIPVGHVGTGFSLADALEINIRHQAAPGRLMIKVRHQGKTESGMLWHARFLSVIPAKEAL